MTPVASWAMADRWAASPGARGGLGLFKRLLLMSLFPLCGLVLVVQLDWWQWLVLAMAVVVGAYVLSSALLYRTMVGQGDKPPGAEADAASHRALADEVRDFGAGLDILPSEWRFVAEEEGVTALASMPGTAGHSLVAVSTRPDGGRNFAFIGRAESGRLLVSTFLQPMFPFKGVDWSFDSEAAAHDMWETHIRVVDNAAVVSFEDFLNSNTGKNPAKEAGFVRLLSTWGRTCFQKRGLLRGF